MKKIFAMLLVSLMMISAIALADDDWSPADEFDFQLEWYDGREPSKHQEELPSWLEEMEEELSAPSQFAYGGDYLVAFQPIRSLSYQSDKTGTSLSVGRDDQLAVLNIRTGELFEYSSDAWLDYFRMVGLNQIYKNTYVSHSLFLDNGVFFASTAPEQIFNYMLRTYNLTPCTSEELLQKASSLEVSFPQKTDSQQNLYRLMRTYMEPMGEGEGEIDCFAFSQELAIIYLRPEAGSEDDVAQAIVYDFKADTLETKTLSRGEFNNLSKDCIRLYFW